MMDISFLTSSLLEDIIDKSTAGSYVKITLGTTATDADVIRGVLLVTKH